MINKPDHEPTLLRPAAGHASRLALKFEGHSDFQAELRHRIEEFFRTSGRRQRDCPEMYVKTGVLLGSLAAIYVLLVVFASTWWQALPLAMLLGLNTAAIGFNVQHDGGHHAYSDRKWVNKLAAMTMDLIGASSYVWHWKHGVIHHTYTNITGHDADIHFGFFGRATPHQKHRSYHRWQHWYLWPLYGLMVIRWELFADFRDALKGRVGTHAIPRPKRWELTVFIAGKAAFYSLAFVIPLLLHPFWSVVACYGAFALILGLTLSVVFQLAHCVEQAAFPMPRVESGNIEKAWAIHQIETTVNFSRRSRAASWLLGGLNYQIEHHLFPRVCHVNYPAMSKVVEATCREYGIRYNEHASFWAGIASHYRWLRRMGTGREAA